MGCQFSGPQDSHPVGIAEAGAPGTKKPDGIAIGLLRKWPSRETAANLVRRAAVTVKKDAVGFLTR